MDFEVSGSSEQSGDEEATSPAAAEVQLEAPEEQSPSNVVDGVLGELAP